MNTTYKQSDAHFSHETCMIQVWTPNYIYLAGSPTFSVPNYQITYARYPSSWYFPVGFSFGSKESFYGISVPLFFVLCDQYVSIPRCSLFQSDNVFGLAKACLITPRSKKRYNTFLVEEYKMGARQIFEELLKLFCRNHVVFQSLPISCERK